MSGARYIGILGGSFDPVHNGHLRLAFAATHFLPLEKVLWIPSAQPCHKLHTHALDCHRVAMLEQVIADHPMFRLDQRDLQRGNATRTVDTIRELKAEYDVGVRFVFLMGADNLLSFTTWHGWQELLSSMHIAVAERPGYIVRDECDSWPASLRFRPLSDLLRYASGVVVRLPLQPIAISSSQVRYHVARYPYDLPGLPVVVSEYITRYHLYQ